MKWPSKMLQNLPYFWNMKTHVAFSDFHFVLLFSSNECRHRLGHSLHTEFSAIKTQIFFLGQSMAIGLT